MTVQELINELEKIPNKNKEVVLRDRECGVIDFQLIRVLDNSVGQVVLTSDFYF